MRLLPNLLFLLFLFPIISYGADSKEVAESVYSEINSPFCKGKLLRDCPSSGASALKQQVRNLAAEGKTKDEIVNSLYSQYGDEIRAVPSSSFLGKTAWVIPFLFIGLALIVMGFWVKSNISRNRKNPM